MQKRAAVKFKALTQPQVSLNLIGQIFASVHNLSSEMLAPALFSPQNRGAFYPLISDTNNSTASS